MILLANMGVFDLVDASKSLDNRLVRAWKHFELFLAGEKLHVGGLRSFSRQKMHFLTAAKFPWLSCKGGDVPVLFKWLQLVISIQLASDAVSAEFRTALEFMQLAVCGGLQFTQGVHGHGIWLAWSCAKHLRQAIWDFLCGYCKLAHWCYRRGYSLYGMVPKLHALAHIRLQLEQGLRQNRTHILNPAVFDCSTSEDFIGRVARQSRRISKKAGFERMILHAYLLKTHFVIKRYRKQNRFMAGVNVNSGHS